MPSHPRPPIVYACHPCNNERKSNDDALLKDIQSLDYQVWQSGQADAQGIFEATRRAFRENNSELSGPVRDARLIWTTVNGIAVPAYEVKLPQGRVERTMATIVRGLSIYYAQRRLPQDTVYVVRKWYDVDGLKDTVVLLNAINAPYCAIGDGSVFDCRYVVTNEDPVFSLWILRFYESSHYTVSTQAPGTTPLKGFTLAAPSQQPSA